MDESVGTRASVADTYNGRRLPSCTVPTHKNLAVTQQKQLRWNDVYHRLVPVTKGANSMRVARSCDVNYDMIERLNNISGLRENNSNRPHTSPDAHVELMKLYPLLTSRRDGPERSLERAKTCLDNLAKPRRRKYPNPNDKLSHDIGDHLRSLHSVRGTEDPALLDAGRIRKLRKLLRKQPFERTRDDNESIYENIKHFVTITSQMREHELKKLCYVMALEAFRECGTTVFGNNGLHLVLKGCVIPSSFPYLKMKDDPLEDFNRQPTPVNQTLSYAISVGECFGTLFPVVGRDINTRVLTVMTAVSHCEFVKIACRDFQTIIADLSLKEINSKVAALQFCNQFKLWPRMSMNKIAELVDWLEFPANKVLVYEGSVAPMMGFIKEGKCFILKTVAAKHKMPNGRRVKRLKQVVMGELGPGQSFGEISVLAGEPVHCTIVTATRSTIAAVFPDKVKELDPITRSLLLQSSKETYANITEADIHDECVAQELLKEWNDYKHGVVVSTINYCGIQPGYGKWANNAATDDIPAISI